MFERFNEKAISVIMLAQEESRRQRHNFIGTEHLLLGLIRENTGVTAAVFTATGVNLERARVEVERLIGRGSGMVSVEIPFTPTAKAVLEVALAIALELGHSYIGAEHILLAIVQEGERILEGTDQESSHSIAFQVLQRLGVDPLSIRDRVMQYPRFSPDAQEEQFSLQPSIERLRTVLPPLSDRALKVWHAMSSQISQEETEVILDRDWIQAMTRLSEADIQSALDELLDLNMIEQIGFNS